MTTQKGSGSVADQTLAELKELRAVIYRRRYARRSGERVCTSSHDNITRCPVCKACV